MAGEVLAQMLLDRDNPQNTTTDMVYGVVTSASPLTIKVENRLDISSSFLILTQPVKELIINFSSHGESHQIQVFENLKVGERVLMIRAQNGQKFIVLDRV